MVDTFVFIATTSTSVSLSVTGVELILLVISTAAFSGLTLTNNVLPEKIQNKQKNF